MCLQGESCLFAHDFTELYAMDPSQRIQRDYDSEDEGEDDTAPDLQAEDLFPSLQATATPTKEDAVPGLGNLSMNSAKAVAISSTPAPPPRMVDNALRRISRPLYHKTPETWSGSRWLETGEAVTTQYTRLREDAYQLACARNRCLMSATRAYQRYEWLSPCY